jgi:cell division protein FtsW (lipid II flippase)
VPLGTGLLAGLPLLTLIAGIGIVFAAPWRPVAPEPTLLLASAVAASAPFVAWGVLAVLAPGFDRILIGTTAMLTAIGMSFLIVLAHDSGTADPFYTTIATRHGIFVGAGFLALAAGAIVARRTDEIRRYPATLLSAALALTALTAVLGIEVNGARLWLSAGPVQFQPSEVARLLIAAFVAVYLHDRRHLISGFWKFGSVDLPPIPYLVPLVVAVVGAMGMLLIQNDLGMAALIALGALAVVLGTGSSRSMTVVALAIVVGAAAGSYLLVGRVRDRVLGWLDPWQDPGGLGFQLIQADFGMASGGFGGSHGLSAASNVPEVHTDLILTGIGSQFGHLAAIAMLALAGVLVARCVLAGLRAPGGFQSLLGLSIASLLAIQILLISGGSIRVIPLTGLTFPLVSYGGTSMVVTMFALGIEAGIGAGRRGTTSEGRSGAKRL